MMIGRLGLSLALGLSVCAGSGRTADWPQFRGPESAGVANSNFPTEWGPEKNVKWKVKIPGAAWSSPIVWGNRVFVTTAVTENQTKPQAGGGFGGPGRGGRGRFGMGGPPQPGQILPEYVIERLKLGDDQKKQLADFQKETQGKLDKIFTEDQRKQLKTMQEGFARFARGGFGGPGGRRGGRGGMREVVPNKIYQWHVLCLDRDTG